VETDPHEIERIIGKILDERVKDYFLFDGEKIERLTRAGGEQKREIARGLRNLLNVDALETAQSAMNKLTRHLEHELSKTASPELARLLKRLGENEEAQQAKRERADEIDAEVDRAREEIAQVDKQLEVFQEIRALLERRKALEEHLTGLEQQAQSRLDLMRTLPLRAAPLLVADTLFAVFHHIDQRKQQGEIPSEIRRDLIEKILSEERCICGNEVHENTEAHARILEWLNRTSDVTIQDAALNLWRYLSEVRSHLSDDAGEVETALIGYGNVRNDIEATRLKLEALREEIGSSERKDATTLDHHRKQLEDKLVRLEAEGLHLESEIAELEAEHERLNTRLNEEKTRFARHDELARRASLARETRDALTEVYSGFTKEIKILLGQEATSLFSELLDTQGRETLRAVVVNDDYSLQVLDRWKRPFLANISAGQRQIMSISFIAALARVASRHGLLEMPLFMDTPFGRLSYEHRKNLIQRVPSLASQWILLATDTEFRRQEATLLKASNRWGKFYFLRPDQAGNTVIEEREISQAQAMLRDEEGLI
jgi:DNA sulfur modification protein DndD